MTTNFMRKLVIDIGVYYFKIHVCYLGQEEKYIEKYISRIVEYTESGGDGKTIRLYDEYENPTILLVFPELVDYAILAHECMHASIHILEQRGIDFDFDNHEAFTYLMGFIFEEVLEKFYKKDAFGYHI